MDKKGNIETTETEEIKPGRNWKESKLIFLVLPIMLTILFPLGVIFYLCGRFCPDLIFLSTCMFYPMVGGFIFICIFTGILRCRHHWRSYDRKRKCIIAAEIVIPIVFVVLFIIPFFIPIESDFWGFGSNAFAHGFRNRIRGKPDIESVRDWLKTVEKKDYTDYLPPNEWPESLKAMNPIGVALSADENSNPNVRVTLAGALPEWGLVIGMENMKISSSDFRHYKSCRLYLEPGAYVWYSH
jgi:hypothetical protein